MNKSSTEKGLISFIVMALIVAYIIIGIVYITIS
jgi:hypothetical protein